MARSGAARAESPQVLRCELGRRGVALPLVLVALVVTSILVAAMLITSATELAIGHAYRDATRALYRADTGLRSFVAAQDWTDPSWTSFASPPDPIRYVPPGAPADDAVLVTISRLVTPNATSGRQVLSVMASPMEGGTDRTVGLLIETALPPDPALPPPGYRAFGWFEVVR